MRRTIARACGLLLALAALSTVLVGPAVAQSSSKKLPSTTLNASGATFPLPYYDVARGEFRRLQPSVTINYAGKGSGTGRQEFSDQIVDFAGSDAPFKPEDAAKVKGGPFFYFPTIAGPITVAYNLSGVKALNLSGATIAKIFTRQITTWNDPAIKSENPKAKLPSTAITVARRSDSSGTTENFTKFLAKAAPESFTLTPGSTVQWPADTQGGAGNPGVAQIVQDTDGAIGYIDYSDAVTIGLSFANVMNKAGKYITPSPESASAALADATVNPDLTYDPLFTDGAKAYPITSPTWLLVYQNQTDAKKGNAIKAFLNYIYGDGQALADEIDYAALDKNLLKQAKAQVNKIVIPAT